MEPGPASGVLLSAFIRPPISERHFGVIYLRPFYSSCVVLNASTGFGSFNGFAKIGGICRYGWRSVDTDPDRETERREPPVPAPRRFKARA